MWCVQMVNQNAQVITHVVNYHQANMGVALYQKQHAVQMESIAALMVTHVVEVIYVKSFV